MSQACLERRRPFHTKLFSLVLQLGLAVVPSSTPVWWCLVCEGNCRKTSHPTHRTSTLNPTVRCRLHHTVQGVDLLLWGASPMSPGRGQRSQQLILAPSNQSKKSLEQTPPKGSTFPQLQQHSGKIWELAHSIWLNGMWNKK